MKNLSTAKSLFCWATIYLFIGGIYPAMAQDEAKLQAVLEKQRATLNLEADDIKSWRLKNEHKSEKFNLTYSYVIQQYQGVEIENAIITFVTTNAQTKIASNRFVNNISSKINTTTPSLTEKEAIEQAAAHLDLIPNEDFELTQNKNEGQTSYKSSITTEPINIKLIYFPVDESNLALVWNVRIPLSDFSHVWNIKIDATNGEIISKNDMILNCDFGDGTHQQDKHQGEIEPSFENHCEMIEEENLQTRRAGTGSYNVFAFPVESPVHGSRTLKNSPADLAASPYGWHDTNGSTGAEYTITRGNNAFAYEDRGDIDGPGYSPNGGANLDFNFSLDLDQDAINYEDAAVTNLFYSNNIMHDVWYQYGFDEASGNFQYNNYGNGGSGNDDVNAEAQDGSGTNNANFYTPEDGTKPRMQMFLWDAGLEDLLTINSPTSLAGTYKAVLAGFGPEIPVGGITSKLILYDDDYGDPLDACEYPVNESLLTGNIAVIMRKDCFFVDKVKNAEYAGAVAVIMINNVAGDPITMGGTDPGINIPSVMVSSVHGALLIDQLSQGGDINATLETPADTYDHDCDFDNGIIAHEYGHGISTRLTGGADISTCLTNDEQMGEGWSDWFGLMLTIEPGDVSEDIRGIGNFVRGQVANGYGIRPAPYTTDWSVNGYTYDRTNDEEKVSMPHGIGFVWATMLWDLNWAMIDKYGLDNDVYYGNGGNNMTMHLVINALKLQACDPGFVDGRDAILLADELLYDGANTCLIWNVFAKRGLGYSADQGSSYSRTDQVEAFDLPPNLENLAGSETITTCGTYTWPADGAAYSESGDYTANLFSVDGCDSISTLHLIVNGNTEAEQAIVEPGSSYVWPVNGIEYSECGIYTHMIQNNAGCDSVISLNLSLNRTEAPPLMVTACDSYLWAENGVEYIQDGIFSKNIQMIGGCDSIVKLNLAINHSNSGTENISVCDNYYWQTTDQQYDLSGTYTALLVNSKACDSTVTLDLKVNGPVPTIIKLNNTTLKATNIADSYQWIDCNTNKPVSGAVNRTFILTKSGNYALQETVAGCVGVSECLTAAYVGIMENSFENDLLIYPNPAKDKLTVDFGMAVPSAEIKVMDIAGKIMYQQEVHGIRQQELNVNQWSVGIYFIKVNTNERVQVMKVFVE